MRATRDTVPPMALPEPTLRQILGPVPPGGAILDLGCHDGALLAQLPTARPDLELAGMDLDRAAVERAGFAVRGADLRVGSIAELPFADATFDLITCMDVVEHLPKPVRAPMFDEVRRVLKPGGRFVLQTPHAGTFQALDAQNLRRRFPALYRRLVRNGVRDRAYAGRQDVVWHRHFTRDGLLRLAGPHWRVDRARYPGLLVWPLADLLMWPFHRVRKTDHAAGQIAPDALSIGMRGETTAPSEATRYC